ncbi:unnamed protein product, partial [Candidula unifasciata]
VVLNAEKRSVQWVVNKISDEENAGIIHTLFLKSAVLGGNAQPGEPNVVVLHSVGDDGKLQKGAIAHLMRGQNPMTPLDITIPGKLGATFILSEGSGPVTIAGNHLVAEDDLLDDTQEECTEGEEEKIENELGQSDEESEEETKGKKSAKRKATPKTVKQKQKAKMDVEDDDQSEEEEEPKKGKVSF